MEAFMKDPSLAVSKLAELLAVEAFAKTEIDRAALYGAARWVTADLEAYSQEHAPHMHEDVWRVKKLVSRVMGYGVSDGDDREVAMKAIQALQIHFTDRDTDRTS